MRRTRLPSVLVLVALLSAGCRYAALIAGSGVIGGAILVDQFLVVDCALPEASPGAGRRAVKTSAHDCKTRGGEFVEAGEANQQTALGVWLPVAEQGDRAAQNYVGEIYEKGLGVAPDHAAAARWYRRAAQAGDARGAVNLAQLYEQGLGVRKDPVEALKWYRQAAGLLDLAFGAAPEAKSTAAVPPGSPMTTADLRRLVDKKLAEARAAEARQGETARQAEAARQAQAARQAEAARLVEAARVAEATRQAEAAKEAEAMRQAEAARVAEAARQAEAVKQAAEASRQADVAQLAADAARQAEAGRRAAEAARQADVARKAADAAQKAAEAARVADAARLAETVRRTEAVRQAEAAQKAGEVARQTEAARQAEAARQQAEAGRQGEAARQQAEAGRKQANEVQALREELARLRQQLETRGLEAQASPRGGYRAEGAQVVGYRRPSGGSYGTYHALVIGNNDYKHLRPLKTGVNDARAVTTLLKDVYNFRVTTLVNATRYDILSALNTMREQLTERDNLLVYYAGHGELDQRNQRGHWLPIDAEPNSSANWISNISISDILNSMSVQQLLVVADSCYSGVMTRSALGRLEGGMTEDDRLKIFASLAQRRSRMVLTSGGIEPVLDSAGGDHSVFAQPFLDLLRANQGVLPGQDLYRHLQVKVASLAEQVDTRQVPEYAPIKYAGHEAGDFFFIRAR